MIHANHLQKGNHSEANTLKAHWQTCLWLGNILIYDVIVSAVQHITIYLSI